MRFTRKLQAAWQRFLTLIHIAAEDVALFTFKSRAAGVMYSALMEKYAKEISR